MMPRNSRGKGRGPAARGLPQSPSTQRQDDSDSNMVYESDFYTSRRPYSRPTITSYSVTRREVPWDKCPTVPRPSQVPPPETAFGRTRTTTLGPRGQVASRTHHRISFSTIPFVYRY